MRPESRRLEIRHRLGSILRRVENGILDQRAQHTPPVVVRQRCVAAAKLGRGHGDVRSVGRHPRRAGGATMTGGNLLLPLRWLPLRMGKVDLAPVVGIAAVFFAGELAARGLTILYSKLPP